MIYLDNGATTFPKPQAVYTAVSSAIREFGANPGRSGHMLSVKAAAKVYETRETVAQFFNVPNVENVIFTLNCTTAANFVIKGLLKSGDHVVVSSLEHNAVMRPINELKKAGISYTVANAVIGDNDATLNNFRNAINEKTKLIICVHASNVWGIKMPIERIAALAHIYNIQIMVDCAQTAGIFPIDIDDSKIDYLCVAGHKGLYGPMGTGVLIVNTPNKLDTIIEGGTGSGSMYFEQPSSVPDKFESGTPNLWGIIGLNASIKYVSKKGTSEILSYEMSLINRLYDRLANMSNVILYTPKPNSDYFAPVLSFNFKNTDSETGAEYLNKMQVATRGGFHCAPSAHKFMGTGNVGAIRIVPSMFTTANEIDRTAYIISKFKPQV